MRAAAFPVVFVIVFLIQVARSPLPVTPSAVAGELAGAKASEVSRLIELLGSDSYATRVRAREKLQRMGLEAFDELQAARDHIDSEISLSARYLVSSLMVSWSKETDLPEVRKALFEYGSRNADERSARIDMIAEFSGRKGLAALARLTRFETSQRLSKRAALAMMGQSIALDPEVRQRNATQIVEVIGETDRQAAKWLRRYAADLASGDYAAKDWRAIIQGQREDIDSAKGGASTRQSVLELVRVCATRAAEDDQLEEALQLATNHIDLIPPTTRDLVDACSWAIDNQLHSFVIHLNAAHRRMFDQHPMLLYGAAEASKVGGNIDEAKRLASQALAIRPLPSDEPAKSKMQPKEIDDTARAHREIAKTLEERGLFQWAESEFRAIIEAMEIDASPAVVSRSDLAQLLGEQQRHQQVIELLRPLAERIESDAKLNQQLNMLMLDPGKFRATLDYHRALLLIRNGKKKDEARHLLLKSFQTYSRNIDVLISMYHLDGDEDWTKTVQTKLQHTIRLVDAKLQKARARARQLGRDDSTTLSAYYNEYAWLVSNTEGDYAKALSYSLKSLELGLDFAKLDTCGRCYFAIGDIENAIKMQKQALKRMPHSPPLKRQLAEFLKAKENGENANAQRRK